MLCIAFSCYHFAKYVVGSLPKVAFSLYLFFSGSALLPLALPGIDRLELPSGRRHRHSPPLKKKNMRVWRQFYRYAACPGLPKGRRNARRVGDSPPTGMRDASATPHDLPLQGMEARRC
jgi:hypothetical protein